MHKLVILNGPPGSGKNTIGEAFAEQIVDTTDLRTNDVYVTALANYPKRMAHRAYGLNSHPAAFEDCKDKPNPAFFDRSPREMYIHFSENVIKPLHGRLHIAHETARGISIKCCPSVVVITDGGFTYEVDHLIQQLPIYEHYVIRLFRKDCDFTNDSREYYRDSLVRPYDIVNNYTVQEAVSLLREIVEI